jgi:hypothetical protein
MVKARINPADVDDHCLLRYTGYYVPCVKRVTIQTFADHRPVGRVKMIYSGSWDRKVGFDYKT